MCHCALCTVECFPSHNNNLKRKLFRNFGICCIFVHFESMTFAALFMHAMKTRKRCTVQCRYKVTHRNTRVRKKKNGEEGRKITDENEMLSLSTELSLYLS